MSAADKDETISTTTPIVNETPTADAAAEDVVTDRADETPSQDAAAEDVVTDRVAETPIQTAEATGVFETPASTRTIPDGAGSTSSTAPTWSAAPQVGTAAATPVAVEPRKAPRVLFGPIVWGFLLLLLAGFASYSVLAPVFAPGSSIDRVAWLFGGVIVAGVALVIVGIAAAFRRG